MEKLKSRKIETVKDLIYFFPYRYEDLTRITKIKDLKINEKAILVGKITNLKLFTSPRKRFYILQGILEDESGKIRIVWYNQPFLAKQLSGKKIVRVIGVLRKSNNLQFQPEKTEIVDSLNNLEKRIVPIYLEINGLRSKYLEKLIQTVLAKIKKIDDPLPASILQEMNIYPLFKCLRIIHQPNNWSELEKAKESLSLRELALLKLATKIEKSSLIQYKAPIISFNESSFQKFISQFKFNLTQSQKKVLQEIFDDFQKNKPMNRLLQGDVGAGKTLIAEICALMVMEAGFQVVMMAPTEILALQHFQRLKDHFKNFPYSLALITSGHSYLAKGGFQVHKDSAFIKKLIMFQDVQLIIGTHSLIENDFKFQKVGLVIIDEQQRFGVEQRKKLLAKSEGYLPHFFSMTATPIPRTLAMAIYGDLDISILEDKPADRKDIKTYLVTEKQEETMWRFVRREINEGHQVFIICPRVEESENEIASVKKEFKKIKEIFPDVEIAMLYGKMKADEKKKILDDLQNNKIKILVSSSVVEVGIDLPLATVIIIDGAERFGLAQLYQLRGRVGRSIHQGFCFLKISQYSNLARQRLKAFLTAKNAFELAEQDLLIRGPGELLGKNQSGLPDFAMQALTNVNLVNKAERISHLILAKSPDLKLFPDLLKVINEIKLRLS